MKIQELRKLIKEEISSIPDGNFLGYVLLFRGLPCDLRVSYQQNPHKGNKGSQAFIWVGDSIKKSNAGMLINVNKNAPEKFKQDIEALKGISPEDIVIYYRGNNQPFNPEDIDNFEIKAATITYEDILSNQF